MDAASMPSRPPEGDGPCSSNGDAAASLAAAFAKSVPFSSAADSTAETESTQDSVPSAPPRAGGDAWRLKFLNKVGIQEAPRAAQEAPELGREPSLHQHAESSGGRELLDAGGPVEVVVVRQAAARRSSDDIRLGYIKKLEHSRAFIPQLNRPKTSQTVTIFDWDDTLLCTSHLEMVQRQYGAIPSQVREQLASLERIVQTLLRQASKTGKVFIITNASEGWVQHSSSLCMPGLQDDLAGVSRRGNLNAHASFFSGTMPLPLVPI